MQIVGPWPNLTSSTLVFQAWGSRKSCVELNFLLAGDSEMVGVCFTAENTEREKAALHIVFLYVL